MDIKDIHVGDIITDGSVDWYVVCVDVLNNEITADGAAYNGTAYSGMRKTMALGTWIGYGYSKKTAVSGLAQTLAQQQAAQNQINYGFGRGILNWLPYQMPAPQTIIKLDDTPPAPSKKTRKQVSHNGKDWVDYRLLLDADDFESYAHRREI
jgi:hypothetical protein